MTMALTEEHRDLCDSVRGFAARHITPAVVRAAVDADSERLPPFWTALADQGLFGLHLPDDVGAGYGMPELAVVTEELGRHLTPGPFLSTVLTSAILDRAGHRTHLPRLADGSAVGATVLSPGTLRATRDPAGTLSVTGTSAPVLGGGLADVFVLPVESGGQTLWAAVSRTEAEVTPIDGHDPTRRLARVTVERLPLDADRLLDAIDPRLPLDLAATLFAAEASGLADRATTTAADYAKVREQFGRPIGQFQGVKHRCARMAARAEQARACAWDAARAQEPGAVTTAEEAALAAAVAGATSVEAAFTTAKDCVQTLGGIGFTWEHDAGLGLRRAQTLRILLGPTTGWQRRVAELTRGGTRRRLSVDLPPEAETVRAGIREELRPATALDGAERTTYLADHGYTAPHLPAPWGKGADAVAQLVIADELSAAGLEPADMIIGGWVVPTLIQHGSKEQQARFLPPTLRGDLVWCQLFSEPGAGSDLAGLSTRAEKTEGGWKLTGQKVWTSMARQADWGICLARTDPDAPRHKGISYFLLDMSSPGIGIRPLRELTGEALFNEVFLDEVFVPDEMLVAGEGDGWKLARTTLANERVSLSNDSSLGSGGETLLALVQDASGQEPGEQRLSTLGQILCDAQSTGLLALRQTLRSLAGGQPGPESSVAKLLGVEHIQQVWETAMDWQGSDALTVTPAPESGPEDGPQSLRTSAPRTATWMFLNTRSLSIAGGTTDVQLNIIGERLLGLSRDPAPPART
ncbi:acyl-CoA dehydrogenase [Streptomyces sp. SID10853]|uniref:acyl-CoA dehydrogenase n=1 Tax=Streptomyces sp. SID10853 TaxID=2706028 RepID=UPI0013C25DF2|nr:acyl-CoA dehydrogenase [Streptomyces sp. SID10853]NDZ78936.1 acyl-CoA dehydrogenase [Streptomyces sp. SID10853]